MPDTFPNVSRETIQKLEAYAEILKKWNEKINLVSRETISDLWNRHILDCLQLAELVPPTATTMIDLGSGAGLPGLILAIALPMHVTLVERDQRKCAFLLEASRTLGLTNVTVRNTGIKTIARTYPLVTARALASLTELCGLAHSLLGKTSICLFPKGENFANEIAEAKNEWSFAYQAIPSKTNGRSVILSLSQLEKQKAL